MTERRRIRVTGRVTGVGFRWFVEELASRQRLGGWVRNAGLDVEIEAEGEPSQLDAFVEALRHRPPEAARVDAVLCEACAPEGEREFRRRSSR